MAGGWKANKIGSNKKSFKSKQGFFLEVKSNLTAPVRVLLLFEDERVAGDVGRCDEVDLDQQCRCNKVQGNIDSPTQKCIFISLKRLT